MKQIAPQINELCEEVMSQSKTPRTDKVLQGCMNYDEGSDSPLFKGDLINHARTLESELTRLSAEKAEVEQRYSSSLDDGLRKSTMYNEALDRAEKAESALLQARQDAQRYRFLRERTAGSVHHNDHWIDFHYEVNATQPHTNDLIWLQTHWAAQQLDIAIDAARQAEPQEGEKE